jgi:hypothetical protein
VTLRFYVLHESLSESGSVEINFRGTGYEFMIKLGCICFVSAKDFLS